MFGLISNSQNQTRKILIENREIEWELVDSLLKKQIKNKVSIQNGINEIKKLLNFDNKNLITESELEKLINEFNSFTKKVLKENYLPNDIKGLYFGIFTSIDNNKEYITIYLSGSIISPMEDSEDWNVEPIYLPKMYMIPSYFEIIKSSNVELNGELEVLIYNGILNLIILENIETYKENIIKSSNEIYIGCGFDSGETYILGKLTQQGLK
ncbi:hypothetical protein KK2020170_16100 [Flavobacterium okayamense]|uniref:EF-hand domain-containing protein n=1 Tax=Flavobacterium okayamense TaxID=2830782 RepID=A0ABM7SDB0_9FLAO|nr:hypothetical protein KK2020170_16100 [Flavobacterium okayamense]